MMSSFSCSDINTCSFHTADNYLCQKFFLLLTRSFTSCYSNSSRITTTITQSSLSSRALRMWNMNAIYVNFCMPLLFVDVLSRGKMSFFFVYYFYKLTVSNCPMYVLFFTEQQKHIDKNIRLFIYKKINYWFSWNLNSSVCKIFKTIAISTCLFSPWLHAISSTIWFDTSTGWLSIFFLFLFSTNH
jgi:hypothetical protein